MKFTVSFYISALFALAPAAPLFCAPDIPPALAALAGPERAAELLARGTITGFQQRGGELILAPRHDFTRALAGEMLAALEPGFLVESLLLYRKPSASAGPWSEAERTALYNSALALSSLAGLQYFSASRNAMRTFYETSAVIDGPRTRRVTADPVFALPPAELTIYARQKDLSFGDNVYQYDYYARQDALIFVQTNLTAMNYGIIPAVGKEKLRSIAAAFDAGEFLVIYAASMAKAASLPGIRERVGNSFSTRAEAILGWFAGQADKVFGK